MKTLLLSVLGVLMALSIAGCAVEPVGYGYYGDYYDTDYVYPAFTGGIFYGGGGWDGGHEGHGGHGGHHH